MSKSSSTAKTLGDRQLVRRGLVFVTPHLKLVGLAALILPVFALSRLLTPYLMKLAIDGPIRRGELQGLAPLALAYFGLVVLQGGLNFSKTYVMQLLGQRVITDMRMALFKSICRLNMSYLDRTPSGKIINRLSNDIDSLNEFLSSGLVEIMAEGIMLIGLVVVMLLLDWRLALYSFCLLPLLMVFVAWLRKLLRQTYSRLSANNALVLSFIAESMSGLTILQAFRRESALIEHHKNLEDEVLDEELTGVRWNSTLSAVVELASYFSIGIVIAFGADRATSLGTLILFIEYIQLFYRPVESLSGRLVVFQKAIASAEKIFLLFDDCDNYADKTGTQKIDKLRHAIQFKAVNFSYTGAQPILKNLNLTIPKGQAFAFVGATGAGKSALVKLLGRFYEINSGAIFWDHVPLGDCQTASLRRRIAYVPQENFLFSESLARNIDLGTSKDWQEAAKAVGADKVAADLPHGFHERLGEAGRNLSAGERQLISVARALAQDPDLLILDEATAHVDGETEALIQESLKTLLKGRTALINAHRLATIRDVDQIVVIHKGEFREQGTHDELIAKRGLYYTLYKLQGEHKTQGLDAEERPLGVFKSDLTASSSKTREFMNEVNQ